MADFLTISEYCRKYKVSDMAVRNAVNTGRLDSLADSKPLKVADEPLSRFTEKFSKARRGGAADEVESSELNDELTRAKIEREWINNRYLEFKLSRDANELLEDHLSIFYSLFSEAFSYFKERRMQSKNFTAEQNAELFEDLNFCINKLDEKLTEYLDGVEREAEQEQAGD